MIFSIPKSGLAQFMALFLVFVNFEAKSESALLPNLGVFNNYASKKYSGLWGYTAPDNREYAILGTRHGTSIVDITDSPALKEISFIPMPKESPWTEMKIYKHYAYVVKDAADVGVQIIDLSQLPQSAKLVHTLRDYPQVHTIWIDEERGYMFLMGGSGHSVVVYSLENPERPVEISKFQQTAYVHDLYVKGNRAYLSEILSQSFSIYDVSDIRNPKFVKRVHEESAPYVSFHNSWTTEDGNFLMTTEETSNRPVRIWDIHDEQNPKQISSWLGAGNLAHNVRIKGSYAHMAHYGGGYRVVDIKNPFAPVEVAYFNPKAAPQSGFVGVWDVYPFFKSGKVIMSSIEDGLYVTQFHDN